MPESLARGLATTERGEASALVDGGGSRALLRLLDTVPAALRGTAGRLGCSDGTLLGALAERFRRVLAIDPSPAVLARARRACAGGRITFHRAEAADLSAFRGRLDVAVTTRVTLPPEAERADRQLAGIRACLRPGGWLIGVFPSTEALLYRGYLREERAGPAGHRARTHAGPAGTPRDVPSGGAVDPVPRSFYAFELRHRLRRAGFSRVRLGRIRAPWDEGGETFRGEPPPWDWLVQATVPARA